MPKSQRVAGIKKNRLEEKEIQRGSEMFNLGDSLGAQTTLAIEKTSDASDRPMIHGNGRLAFLKKVHGYVGCRYPSRRTHSPFLSHGVGVQGTSDL